MSRVEKTELQFSKMHGLGNDFMVIDAVNQSVDLSTEQIRFLADRHFGVGFDQLLLVEAPDRPDIDFKYRIYNADGGEVEQCGNGARCFSLFVKHQGLSDKNPLQVSTAKGIISLMRIEDQVNVEMGIPNFSPQEMPFIPAKTDKNNNNQYHLDIPHSYASIDFSAVSIGNPHITIIVTDIENYPVTEVGKILESHPSFPNRVNVGFMQINAPDQIQLRVYERGCGETLACGSGACAAVANGINRGLLDNQVSVHLRGGELSIKWEGPGHPIQMKGSASFVYQGQIDI